MSDPTFVLSHVSWDAPEGADGTTKYVLLFQTPSAPTFVTEIVGVVTMDVLLLWQRDYHLIVYIDLGNNRFSKTAVLDFRTPEEFE